MPDGPVLALVDGEHHPSVVREALDALDAAQGVAGVVFCGGEEKTGSAVLAAAAEWYGRPVELGDPVAALRRLAQRGGVRAVVDLADEPVLSPQRKLRLASVALDLGLEYRAPGTRLRPPSYAQIDFAGPKLAVIGTGKRTGKTAVAGHWAGLLAEQGARPVIVSMGRGGPAEPQLARADTSLDDLIALAEAGRHAASDYLEDAVLAGVDAVGCRRVGGGLAGEVHSSNVLEGATLAVSRSPGTILFEGSGACVPPIVVDRTVCVVGDAGAALRELGPYRLMRSQLALLMGGAWDPADVAEVEALCAGAAVMCELRPEPAEPVPEDARVALFTTNATSCAGVDPVTVSTNLARRGALADDLARAAGERCDVYLVELKAAAIDTVAIAARREGKRVVFVRNRPVGVDADLDAELTRLHRDA
jgi:cyclic 2,3-diphosphoglycerate synthetase